MNDESSKTSGASVTDTETVHVEARRKFLKSAGQVAVTTPAVTLLLAAGTKRANAGVPMIYDPIPADPNDGYGDGVDAGLDGADPGLGSDTEADAGDPEDLQPV